jgi:hypothetical protein
MKTVVGLRSLALGVALYVAWSVAGAVLDAASAAEPKFVRQSLSDFVRDPQKLASLIRGVNEMKRRSAAPADSAEYRTSWEYWANIHGYPGTTSPTGTVEQVRMAREMRFPEDAPLYAGFYAGLKDLTPPDKLAQEVWATCPHSTATTQALHFLSWHRMYLFFFERVLREASGDSTFALPYWDYTNNKTSADPTDRPWAVPSVFGQQTLDTTGGPLPNPLFERRRTRGFAASVQLDVNNVITNVDSTLALDDFFDFQLTLERTIHGHIHCTVGNGCLAPYIGIVPFAGNDILFWLHHANIDRLWECWTTYHGQKSNPISDETWMKAPFTFVDEKGARAEMKVAELFDPKGRIDFRYANVSQCFRIEPKVKPLVVAGGGNRLLAEARTSSVDLASAERVVVSTTNQEVALQRRTDQASDDARISATRPNSLRPSKVKLRLENVEFKKDPGVSIAVHLVDSKSKQRAFVGVISFFGAFDHDAAHAHDAPKSLNRITFDVTSQFQTLQSGLDSENIHVALEATSGLSGSVPAPNEARMRAAEVVIGRIRLEAETSTIVLDLR